MAIAGSAGAFAGRWRHLLPVLAVLGSVVSLATGTSFAKQLFPLIGAQGTSALRVGFSALILLVFWRPWRWSRTREDWRNIVRYGLALGCMNFMFYMAIRTIPFGIAVVIEFTGPLSVALFSSRRWLDYLWAGLAVAGLLLLLPLNANAQELDPVGVMFALAAAVCWGAYIIFGQRMQHLHAGHSVSLGLLVASVVVVPVGVVHAGSALLNVHVLSVGVVVAVVSSAIPMSLEMVALKRLPRETFGILTSMEPAVAALMALALLNERLSLLQWCAIVCTVLASMGCAATVRRPSMVSEGMRKGVLPPQ